MHIHIYVHGMCESLKVQGNVIKGYSDRQYQHCTLVAWYDKACFVSVITLFICMCTHIECMGFNWHLPSLKSPTANNTNSNNRMKISILLIYSILGQHSETHTMAFLLSLASSVGHFVSRPRPRSERPQKKEAESSCAVHLASKTWTRFASVSR